MRIAADTNVLVRFLTDDDPAQEARSADVLEGAESVFISTLVLCELAWVLRRRYGIANAVIASAIRGLLDSDRTDADRSVAEYGLRMLEKGGDFADGVVLHDAEHARAEALVTFDRRFVALDWSGKLRLLD